MPHCGGTLLLTNPLFSDAWLGAADVIFGTAVTRLRAPLQPKGSPTRCCGSMLDNALAP